MNHPSGPEIILNLWYVHDEQGVIYSLRARAYVAMGSDEEKLELLKGHAMLDYLIATPFPIPERFHPTFIELDGKRKMPVALKSAIEVTVGLQNMFEDLFVALEKGLPAQTKLSIGRDPLVCITPVLGNDEGALRVNIEGAKRF
jgi:hypothetical protein